MGVPRADGFFGKCDPNNKKNYRTRCSAIIQTSDENILIDTSPDLRKQLLDNKIIKIDKVLYSHMHADQTHGINDLRVFFIKNKKPIPVYADKPTSKYLMNSFSYCFSTYNNEYPATLKLLDEASAIHYQNKAGLRLKKLTNVSVSMPACVLDCVRAYVHAYLCVAAPHFDEPGYVDVNESCS